MAGDGAAGERVVDLLKAAVLADERADGGDEDGDHRRFKHAGGAAAHVLQQRLDHGAQMLVAIAAAHELGYQVSAFEIIPNLFYPFLLAVSSFFFIAIDGKKKA